MHYPIRTVNPAYGDGVNPPQGCRKLGLGLKYTKYFLAVGEGGCSKCYMGLRYRIWAKHVLIMENMLQNKMGKSKDKEKAKRLFETTPNKGTTAKVARTEEQVLTEEGEARSSPGPGTYPALPFVAKPFDSQDMAASPSHTEEDFGMAMILGSPLGQRERKERVTRVTETQELDPAGQGNVLKVEPASGTAGLKLGPEVAKKEHDTKDMDEGLLDWKIPTTFRLDWIVARVDQLLIQMDVVGGMYEPVFVAEGSSPAKIRVQKLDIDVISPKKEPLSFFKIRIKAGKSKPQEGIEAGARVSIYAREEVRENVIKCVEILNQNKNVPMIGNCLEMIKHAQSVQARQNTFAGRAAGRIRLERLREYGLRKLVHLAQETWGMRTALPILPLIKTAQAGTAEITVFDLLLNKSEDSLIMAFAGCDSEQSKDLAIDYWASIIDIQSSISGNDKSYLREVWGYAYEPDKGAPGGGATQSK